MVHPKSLSCLAGVLALVLNIPCAGVAEPAETVDGMPLVFSDDFAEGMDHWTPTDSAAWKVHDDEGTPVMAMVAPSRYEPPVRSPRSIAWADGINVGNFVLEVRAKQTGREYGHRDLCFFFGKQGDDQFYYVHLATKADAHANSIFLVNEAPRVSIAEERTEGTDWGTDVWHTIRIKRDVASGRIEVFFNDLEKPVMVAHDATFTTGALGLGSFDDQGQFAGVRVWGETVKADDAPEAESDSGA
jgi:hypothetical protein